MKRALPAIFLVCVALLACAACSKDEPKAAGQLPPVGAANGDPAAVDDRPVIVVFGDSLSAGYGLLPGEAFPDHLQKLLDAKGLRYRIVNQGISGDTTTGGLARVDQALALKPKVVLLELGGNDGLRGLSTETMRDNLEKIVLKFTSAKAQVILIGISIPRNYGDDYVKKFDAVYTKLAYKHELDLVPFLLKGIWSPEGATPGMVQEDGIHPTAKGTPVMAQTVFPVLARVLAHLR